MDCLNVHIGSKEESKDMTTAELEKLLRTQLEIGKPTLEAMKTLEKLAKESVDAGDKADLAAAIGGTQRPSKLAAQKDIGAPSVLLGWGESWPLAK